MVWAKEQVLPSFEPSLAAAGAVCCRCCESEQAGGGTRFVWFIVSPLIPWHLERARQFPGMWKAGKHILWAAEGFL